MPRNRTLNELRQARKLSFWVSIAVLLVGVIGVLIYGVFLRRASSSVPVAVAYVLGTIFLSAGLISLILGRVSVEESRVEVRWTVEQSIEDLLRPLRAMIDEDSQREYRWHCLLSLPDGDGQLTDYALQEIEVSKEVSQIPKIIKLVCIASKGDAVLEQYAEDPECLMRWVVDDELNPQDEAVFSIDELIIDGFTVPLHERKVFNQPLRVEYRYRRPVTPSNDEKRQLSWRFHVRKYFGSDERVEIRTQVFSTTFGAEFRCTVGESIALKKFNVNTSEVSTLGSPGRLCSAPVNNPRSLASLAARFDSPLQPGSTIVFRLERRLGSQ